MPKIWKKITLESGSSMKISDSPLFKIPSKHFLWEKPSPLFFQKFQQVKPSLYKEGGRGREEGGGFQLSTYHCISLHIIPLVII